ncbi:MAG: hypothetical protein WDO24_05740 [Pseudomonadota bacterium]
MNVRVAHDPEEQGLDVVARRFGRSIRWLQNLISQPRFQFHHYVGRSPRWDERQYQALHREIDRAAREVAGLPRSKSSGEQISGSSTAPTGEDDAQAACDAVLSYLRGQGSGATLPAGQRRLVRHKTPATAIETRMPKVADKPGEAPGAAQSALPQRRAEPVIGATAIAARLGITEAQFHRLWNPDKRANGSKQRPRIPVRKSPIGLVGDGPTLDAWWRAYLRGEAD